MNDEKHISEEILKVTADVKDYIKNLNKSSEATKDFKKNVENIDDEEGLKALGKAAETVKAKFSVLEATAVMTLSNIATNAFYAGKRMIDSLTIDPINDGFKEYELKMGSVQTIMAGTGEDLSTVMEKLNELNTYADKTIYSFSDMTSNIGKFTNAGVKLDMAVAAIQGISNEAAVSGANAEEASRAMYNFAQALSAGYVKLIDWKSIENANMATMEFKNQLLETALELGTVVEEEGMFVTTTEDANGHVSDLFDATRNFNDSLSHQWMTTEVLTQTLAKYADETTEIGQKAFRAAQDVKTFTQLMDTLKEAVGSGWAESFELIIGNFDEAKALYSEISDVVGGIIDQQSKARNQILSDWHDLGGRIDLFEGLKAAVADVYAVFKPIKEAFIEVFPPATGAQLSELTKRFRTFVESLKITDETAIKIKNTFHALFSIVKTLINVAKAAIKIIYAILKPIISLLGNIWSLTSALGKLIDFFIDFGNYLNVTTYITEKALNAISFLVNKLKEFGRFLFGDFKTLDELVESLKDSLRSLWKTIHDTPREVPVLNTLIALYEKASERLKMFIGVQNEANDAIDETKKSIKDTEFYSFMTKVIDKIKEYSKVIKDEFIRVFEYITEKIQNAKYDEILDVFNTGILGGLSISIIKFLNGLAESLEKAGKVEKGIYKIFKAISKGIKEITEAYAMSKKAESLLVIAKALAIMAASIVALALIDSESLGISLGAFTALFAELAILLKVAGGMLKSDTVKNIASLYMVSKVIKALSFSIGLIAVSIMALSKLDPTSLVISIIGVAAIMAGLIILIKAINKIGVVYNTKTQIMMATSLKGLSMTLIAFAASIRILVNSVKVLGEMDFKDYIQGLIGVELLIGSMVIVVNAMTKLANNNIFGASLKKVSTVFIAFGAAITILSKVVKKIGEMKVQDAIQGILGVNVLIAGMTLFMLSMTEFSKASIFTNPAVFLTISIGLIAFAESISILSDVVKSLGEMDFPELLKGLGAFVAILTTLALLSKGLSIFAGAMYAVGAAVALFGVGIGAAGIGMLKLVEAFILFGTIGSDTAKLAVSTLETIAIGFATILPKVAEAFAKSISSFFRTLLAELTSMASAIKDTIFSWLRIISESIPGIVEIVLKIVISVLDELITYTPLIVDKIITMLINLINEVTSRVPELVTSVWNLISTLFVAVYEVFSNTDFDILLKILEGVGIFTAIAAVFNVIAELIPGALLGALGMAALIAEIGLILAAFGKISEIPGFVSLINEGGNFIGSVGTAIGKFIGGLIGGATSSILDSVGSVLPSLGTYLSDFMVNLVPFISGAKTIDSDVLSGISILSLSLLELTASELINGLTSLYFGTDMKSLGEELKEFGLAIVEYSNIITSGNIDEKAIKASAEAAMLLSELESSLPNSGGILSFYIGDNTLAKMAEELMPFGLAIVGYGKVVKNLDAKSVKASTEAAMLLSELESNLPLSGGLLSFYIGDNTLAKMAEELIPFGEAISAYAKTVSKADFSNGKVEESIKMASLLSELESNLSMSGGLFTVYIGDNTLSKFAEHIKPLGEAMLSYSEAVSKGDGINVSKVEESVKALQSLADLESSLPAIGGLVSLFKGGNSLKSFGMELPFLAVGLFAYNESLKGKTIEEKKIKKSVKALKSLANLESSLPAIGGIVSLFKGGNSLSTFGIELPFLAIGLNSYNDSLKNTKIEEKKIKKSVNALKALADLEDSLPAIGGIVSLFKGGNSLKSFGKELPQLAKGLREYNNELLKDKKGINIDTINKSTEAAKAIVEVQKILKDSNIDDGFLFGKDYTVDEFGNDLKGFGYGMKSFFNSINDANFDSSKTDGAVKAGKGIAEIASALSDAHIEKGFIFDTEYTVDDFGRDINDFGIGIKSFCDAICDKDFKYNDENVNEALEIANGILTISDGLSKLDWQNRRVISKWVDVDFSDYTLHDFSIDISIFADGLKEFSNIISNEKFDLKTEKIDMVIAIARSVVDLANELPEWKTGFISVFNGEYTLEDFSSDLSGFANALKSFVNKTSEIDFEKYNESKIKGLIRTVSEILKKFPKDLKLMNAKIVKNNLDVIFENLDIYMGHIIKLKSSLSENGIKDPIEFLDQYTKSIIELSDMMETVSKVESGDVKGFTEITTISYAVERFSDTLYNSKDKIKDSKDTTYDLLNFFNEIAAENKFSPINSFITTMASAGTSIVKLLVEGLIGEDAKNKISTSIQEFFMNWGNTISLFTYYPTNVVKNFINGIYPEAEADELLEKFIDFGIQITKNVTDGITKTLNNPSTNPTNNIHNMFKGITSTLNSFKTFNNMQSWYDIGHNIVTGIANGIRDYTSEAVNAAENMSQQIINATATTLDIHSPSKELYKMGAFAGQGLINALYDYANKVYSASENLADNANKALESSLIMLEDGVDTDITLTPIVDLSEIQNGIDDIDSMFRNSYGVNMGYRNSIGINEHLSDKFTKKTNSNNINNETSNTFYINGNNNPKEVANEVSKILQKQVERRSAVWG